MKETYFIHDTKGNILQNEYLSTRKGLRLRFSEIDQINGAIQAILQLYFLLLSRKKKSSANSTSTFEIIT